MNDSENPSSNSDWSLILPTVTQAVNRQMIHSLGITRESLHFNSPSEYFPIAHITNEAQNELQDVFNTFDRNFYENLVASRIKRQAYLNRAKVPTYYVGQLVFIKNLEPAPGSTILKLPYRGPYRVKNITSRNLVIVDLESGREVNTHLEYVKPLSLKEFKLLLSKGLDLNINNEKRKRDRGGLSPLDFPKNPQTTDAVEIQ